MKKYINIIKAGVLTTIITVMSSSMVLAETFKDVSESYWAHSSIEKVVNMGIMYGDLSGNFNPEGYIDKFDTAKIFARLAGYKTSNLTPEDTAYYEKLYQEKKTFLEQFDKTFVKWNSTSDKEIAYLLEKGIMTDVDLNQFVIKDSAGNEQLRALSREEAAVFLVRFMKKEDEALRLDYQFEVFSDDESITASRKPYIYYLKSIGIITGASENVFKPKGAATKSTLAFMIDSVLNYKENNSDITQNQEPSIEDLNTVNIASQVGTIDKIFPALNVVQLNIDDAKKLYKLSPNASIKIDGNISQISSLKEGMVVDIVVSNSDIIKINATSEIIIQTTEQTTEQTTKDITYTTTEEDEENQEDKDKENKEDKDKENKEDKDKENQEDKENEKDEEDEEDEEETTNKKNQNTNNNSKYNFIDEDISSLKSCIISSITIDNKEAIISFKYNDKKYSYPIDKSTVDVYSLRLDDDVKLTLDDDKVIAVSINEAADKDYITGYIKTIKDDYITIQDINSNVGKRIKVYFDDDTSFINSSNGKKMSIGTLEEDMKIYVTLKSKLSNDAKTIILLSGN